MAGLESHTQKQVTVTKPIRFLTIAIAINSLVFTPTTLNAETSPLLQKVRLLKCAKNQQEAKTALEVLRTLPTAPLGLPTENLTSKPDDRLYAGSLDITLDVLVETSNKYPELRNLVERTILKWNYCKTLEDGQFFDVLSESPRKQVDYLSPLKWKGFEQLGFLQPVASFIPKLLSKPPIGKQAFEEFFHRIYRKQCFPHPTTGELYHQQHGTISQKLSINKIKKTKKYPYLWDNTCPQDKKPEKKPTKVVAKAAEIKPVEEPKPEVIETNIIEKPIKPEPIKKKTPTKVIVHVTFPSIPPVEEETKPAVNVPALQSIKETPPKKSIQKEKAKPKKLKKITPIALPTKKDYPIVVAPVSSAAANSSAPVVISTKDPDKSFGLTGNVYMKYRLANEKPTFGINASWKPIAESYWFARMNLDYDYTKDDPLSYSWGLGYDDWHKGTWSAQINHWGPIKRGQGLDIDKAIGNIGYKFKGKWLEKYNLSSNTSVDIPVKGDPALNLGLSWTPKENWFARANINQPLNGGEPTWSYAFGYSNWRPNKWNIEYANYGPNNLFDTNFRKNGIVNISYNWEF